MEFKLLRANIYSMIETAVTCRGNSGFSSLFGGIVVKYVYLSYFENIRIRDVPGHLVEFKAKEQIYFSRVEPLVLCTL